MSEEQTEKTPADKLHDVISQLKEMDHYAKANMEKLAEIWLLMDDEIKNKKLADRVNDLLKSQDAFQQVTATVIEECEAAGEKLAKPKKA